MKNQQHKSFLRRTPYADCIKLAMLTVVTLSCFLLIAGSVCAKVLAPLTVQEHMRQEALNKKLYAVYFKEELAGYQAVDYNIKSSGASSIFSSLVKLVTKIDIGDKPAYFITSIETLFDFESGKFISSKANISQPKKKKVILRVPVESDVLVKTVEGKKTESRLYKNIQMSLDPDVKFDNWIRSNPKEKATFKYTPSSATTVETENSILEVVLIERKTITFNGKPETVSVLDVTDEKGKSYEWEVTDNADTLRFKMDMMELVRLADSDARKFYQSDISKALIPVKSKILCPPLIEEMIFEIKPSSLGKIPEDKRQKVIERKKDTIKLKVINQANIKSKTKLSKSERKKYLEPVILNPNLDNFPKEIKDLTSQIKPLTDSSKESIDNKIDDLKTEFYDIFGDEDRRFVPSVLFVKLTRKMGIPSRIAKGVAYSDQESSSFVFLNWVEYHDGDRWVSIDPVSKESYADATHLKLFNSQGGLALSEAQLKECFKIAFDKNVIKVSKVEEPDFKKYAKKISGKYFYDLYKNGKKAGLAIANNQIITKDGHQFLLKEISKNFKKTSKKKANLIESDSLLYSLEGKAPLSFILQEREASKKTKLASYLKPQNSQVIIKLEDKPEEKTDFELGAEKSLSQEYRFKKWLRSKLKPGDQFELNTVILSSPPKQAVESYKYVRKTTIKEKDAKDKALVLEKTAIDGKRYTEVWAKNGRPLILRWKDVELRCVGREKTDSNNKKTKIKITLLKAKS